MDSKIQDIHDINNIIKNLSFFNKIHPLFKFLLAVIYLFIVMSVNKYNMVKLLILGLYIVVAFNIDDLYFKNAIKKLRIIFVLLLFIGLPNIFLDKKIVDNLCGFNITGGLLSFLTLYIKGCYGIFTSYILIVTTGIENICYVLSLIRVPKTLITVILLTYRYIILFAKESKRMWLSYSLRAPMEKGIHISAWGSMIGAMLLRSIDRAYNVYESMKLRGFNGIYTIDFKDEINKTVGIMYFFIMLAMIVSINVLW